MLVERYLKARKELEQGDESDMIVFENSCLGLAYEYRTDVPGEDALRERALDYQELTVPAGGLELTVGVDVQHDRLAIIVRAWGRGEESWLVFWGEISAARTCIDPKDPVYEELDRFIFGVYQHELGFPIHVSAATIDSSDGQTNDAVYQYVRSRRRRGVKIMSGKGESNNLQREIVSPPKKVDLNNKTTKASKYGLQVHVVGVHKAKDLFFGRLKLEGHGPGRIHFYEHVRSDYFTQVLSEIKAPSRQRGGRKVYQKKSGVRNEALDCEIYALHAARVMKLHVRKPDQWDAREASLKQGDLLAPAAPERSAEERPAAKPVQTSKASSEGGSLADIARRMR